MTYKEEKPLRLKRQLSEQAVTLAMQGRWQEVVEVNKKIIEEFSPEVEAYNRLGKAYMGLGDYAQAREAYNKAAEIDPFNAIARKNLQRLNYLKEEVTAENEPKGIEPQHFIQEIGKAGMVSLFDLAPREIRARMVAGDRVHLKPEGTSLITESTRGEYLGQVESRHALRLLKMMEGGNQYSAAVISSMEESLTIIIREVYQHPSQVGRLSFPPKGVEAVQPYASDRIVKVESEYDREADMDSGYTIIGGEEIEVLAEESGDAEEETANEEE